MKSTTVGSQIVTERQFGGKGNLAGRTRRKPLGREMQSLRLMHSAAP